MPDAFPAFSPLWSYFPLYTSSVFRARLCILFSLLYSFCIPFSSVLYFFDYFLLAPV